MLGLLVVPDFDLEILIGEGIGEFECLVWQFWPKREGGGGVG